MPSHHHTALPGCLAALGAALHLATACASPERVRMPDEVASWVVDSAPVLLLGADLDARGPLFGVIVGATRLPDGGILVADRQEHALHFYDAEGTHLRSTGRRGSGPGEYTYPAAFWRCGDQVLLYDIEGYRIAVLSLQGEYLRAFRFGAGAQLPGSSTPYRSACNPQGRFAHYGWEDFRAIPPAGLVFRQRVPFWLTEADSGVVAVLDSFPGAERVLQRDQAGQIRGTLPRIFGGETHIALGRDRLYIGAGDGPVILAVDLASLETDSIHLPLTLQPLTREMIDVEKAMRLAATPPNDHRRIETLFDQHPFPETVPPYAGLVVDGEDRLWVQEYPLAGTPLVRWLVLEPTGALLATATLPSHLRVFEIGSDYILGRFVDPIEAIPQVRLYRLRR